MNDDTNNSTPSTTPNDDAPVAYKPTAGVGHSRGTPPPSASAVAKGRAAHQRETPKEAVTSIIMSFAMVFIFSRFVVASYVIPTGSMAPTLNGAHMRFWSPDTGANWAVNPWDYANVRSLQSPRKVQGASAAPIHVDDPYAGTTNAPLRHTYSQLRKRIGDRIFVLKYLYTFFEPERWDVVVFKFPGNSRENYIKRLVGLPNEEIFLVAGDVFTRPTDGSDTWHIQRKPERIQNDLWYTLYSSEFRPIDDTPAPGKWAERWIGDGWDIKGASRSHSTNDTATLTWNHQAHAINDWVSYNDVKRTGRGRPNTFPVSDLRLRATVEQPSNARTPFSFTLKADLHIFEAHIDADGHATLRMKPDAKNAPWDELETADVSNAIKPSKAASVELIRLDQSLELRINNKRIAYAEYDWSPEERLANSMGRRYTNAGSRRIEYENPGWYKKPSVSMTFDGPIILHRIGLDRDLFYQPLRKRARRLGEQDAALRATAPETTIALTKDHFFVLGDNSPSSGDSRVWSFVDPWVGHTIDDTIGVVPRELMMGKAFFVFWPAHNPRFFIPDVGRMRSIR